jgi:uncharacterized protein (UPF0332 family)
MTNAEHAEEIRANWQRAAESLDAAKLLLENDHSDIAASRAYYGALYAVCALLLADDKEYSKHSSVLSALHRDYVRTGQLSHEDAQAFSRLFELRGIGDYGETRHVSEEQARKAVDAAAQFIDSCGRLLRSRGFKFCG